MTVPFKRAVATEDIESAQLNQIIDAWEGDEGKGNPLVLTEVDDADNYAADVRNKDTTNSLVARFRNAAGELLLSIVKEALTIGKNVTAVAGVTFDGVDVGSHTHTGVAGHGPQIPTAGIAADAVTGAKIVDDAVDSEHYTDGSIDTAHLAADVVDGTKIADDAVDSEHIVAGAIDTAHLGAGQVTNAKLGADAVTGAKIADDAVNSEHIAAGSIDTAHIGNSQVTTEKLAADAVTGAKIADDAIDSEHYVDGSIDTAHIAAQAVATGRLEDGAVTAPKIADDAVNSEHIAAGSINTEHIGSAQVTGAKIANGAVTNAKLGADAVTGAKIANDAVNSEHYTDGSIDAVHLAANAVETAKIKDANVTAAKIGTGAVTAAKIGANAVDDTKVGNRVPQFYRRQGGHATNWAVQGTTDYTPTAVRMQTGVKRLTIGVCSQTTCITATPVTFPVEFTGTPNIFLTHLNVAHPELTVFVANVSTTGFDLSGIVLNGFAGAVADIMWWAVGSE